MSKKKRIKQLQELLDTAVSANESTGSYQQADLDLAELSKYQKQYNNKKKK